ncbi:MAG TPA: hypothetical protein VHU15_12985 [Stellaceae bacterium]|jgi:hypothetical protein|nr:hypothetical protein [Stellaceae bacterium]
MLRPTKSRWLKRIGLAGVAAVSLAAVTLPTAPAQAQVVVGFGSPYYAPYYGYPYGYGYPGVVFGFGGGWHHHHHHW